MLYLALGAAALAVYLFASGGKPILKRREWRFLVGALALAAFTGAAFFAVTERFVVALVLLVAGLWLMISARRTGLAAPKPDRAAMALDEARSILGVSADATPDEIQAAYTRLMRLAHPDKGGTSGLAAQLNAARDRLLRR